jgi:hypothetical protein
VPATVAASWPGSAARARPRWRFPGDGVVEAAGGLGDVVGEVHVTDLLLAGPCAAERVGGVAGGEGGAQSRPAGVVDAFGAEEQQLADVVERVTLPAPVDAGVEGGGDEGVPEAVRADPLGDAGGLGRSAGPSWLQRLWSSGWRRTRGTAVLPGAGIQDTLVAETFAVTGVRGYSDGPSPSIVFGLGAARRAHERCRRKELATAELSAFVSLEAAAPTAIAARLEVSDPDVATKVARGAGCNSRVRSVADSAGTSLRFRSSGAGAAIRVPPGPWRSWTGSSSS